MDEISAKALRCKESIRRKTDFEPQIAIVLGSGLGAFAENIEAEKIIGYNEVDGFAAPTVSGHKGRIIFGKIGKVRVAALQGRIHYYEGHSMNDVVMPARTMRLLGAETLILTNAAGAINKSYKPGDFMLIKGHISSLVPSPLIGANTELFGERFPDMSEVYDCGLRECVKNAAKDENINIHEGVYIQTSGPNYETPEEVRMFGMWGADAVGMSTACEAMAACHAGMRVCGLSVLSNMAAGISANALSHEEVKQTADMAADNFKRLLLASVEKIAETL